MRLCLVRQVASLVEVCVCRRQRQGGISFRCSIRPVFGIVSFQESVRSNPFCSEELKPGLSNTYILLANGCHHSRLHQVQCTLDVLYVNRLEWKKYVKSGKKNRKGTQEDRKKKKTWEGREWKEAQKGRRTVITKGTFKKRKEQEKFTVLNVVNSVFLSVLKIDHY